MKIAATPIRCRRESSMRLVLLLSSTLLAACGASPQGAPEPAAATSAAAAPRLDFPAKMRIPARLDLLATADGGRAAAIPPAWRAEVEFDGGTGSRCGFDRGEAAELEPGASHQVELLCNRAVQLPDDGRRGFRVIEAGRVVGSGVVLP
ncbi:MAG TPA: hypothetical protein VIG97_02700 [Luteimonas sp.]